MTTSEHVTIRGAARRYRVSDKKLQRAIRAEKLTARYPKPNRCEIAVSDLERFLSGQVSGQSMEPLESRVAGLEQRVADLEDLVQRLLKRQEGSRPRQASPAKERTTGSLPRQFISLLAFAQLHNVAESKILAHMDTGLLPVKRGECRDKDGSVVTLALDPAGKRAFHQIYHGVPPFFACKQCPHEKIWTVSRQKKHDRRGSYHFFVPFSPLRLPRTKRSPNIPRSAENVALQSRFAVVGFSAARHEAVGGDQETQPRRTEARLRTTRMGGAQELGARLPCDLRRRR